MSTTLPRPDVSVEQTSNNLPGAGINVTITRDGKGNTYHGDASDTKGAVKDVIEKILNDPKTAEWLP